MSSSTLFSPFTIRGTTFKNRVAMSPMCQYSSHDGAATDWHLVHLGSRAAGGASLVMIEATAVEPEGRISPEDMGIWADKHVDPLRRITSFVREQKCLSGIQLAHAGRKAATRRPWDGGKPLTEQESWKPVGPSPVRFAPEFQEPEPLSKSGIEQVLASFVRAAERALAAGFDVIEIHSAHGYLLHSFLSPVSNQRTDEYGGSLENRTRLLLQVAKAVRTVIPNTMPLFVRLSCTDWIDNGWDLEQSIYVSERLKEEGVDLIDCSSGGTAPHAKIPMNPGYQVPFSEAIRNRCKIPTAAVGLIRQPSQADEIVAEGKADFVFLGRELLRDPYWILHAAKDLGQEIPWPPQYLRARD